MSSRLFFSLVISFLHAGISYGATSHCTSEETVVFSCSLGNKTVSVCGSKGFTGTSGYLQYRFGKHGAPENIYPSLGDPPTKYTERQWVPLGGGGEAYLRFKKANYAYVVYSSYSHGNEFFGVVVEKNGKVIANHKCRNNPIPVSIIDWTDFGTLGLPEGPQEFDPTP